MKFLANENFPLASVNLLRKAGYVVISVSEEMAGEKDSIVLSRAAQEKLIILTFDRDYGDLIYKSRLPVPFGVVYFRFDPATPNEPYEQMLTLFKIEGLVLEGKFTVTNRQQTRQRPLPSEK